MSMYRYIYSIARGRPYTYKLFLPISWKAVLLYVNQNQT